ncbi:MAG: glycosyltransferase [Opitutus sp.]|nr:glycosyltransferase [Opitutus sp.]
MKIAFICTSLASGRDGVGDYVRQLAESCTREGHQCLLIAVNERPSTPDRDCVHLLSTTPWAERAARLSKALADFDPDWVSWQIVSYGLHPKGIIPRDAFALADVTRRWPTQVMVHELWIGLAAGEPWKARLIGRWQKPRLLDFLRRLEPRVLHTSNPTYQAVLRAAGFRAQQLPLFGNIPIAPCAPGDAEDVLDDVAGLRLPLAPRWVAVTFGTVHPQWDAAATLRWLRAAAVSAGRSAVLLAVGRIGGAATTALTRVGRQHPDIPIVITGELSPEKVSALLQASDFGIATHPWALIEKKRKRRRDVRTRSARARAARRLAARVRPRHGGSQRTVAGANRTRAALRRRELAGLAPRARRPAASHHEPLPFRAVRAARRKPALRMNFLFYAPQMAPYGGMERHICGLANALAARGHHVELLTTSNSLGRELRDGLLTHGVLLHELPIDRGHARHRSAAFRKAWWLLQKSLSLRRTTWDVIYTNGQSALSRLVWIAGRARTRIVHHHHTAADEDEQGSWSPIFRHVIGRAREIVACSRATQAALETALHRHDVSFLPYLTSAAMPAARVEEISYDDERPLHFAFMGRLVPEKGIDAILALSRRASLADIRWHIHGAGAGYDEELFRNYPNVVYHGPFAGMGAMGPALRTTDALVLFSLHNEGMPLSLIEGMSAGLP